MCERHALHDKKGAAYHAPPRTLKPLDFTSVFLVLITCPEEKKGFDRTTARLRVVLISRRQNLSSPCSNQTGTTPKPRASTDFAKNAATLGGVARQAVDRCA